MHEPCGYLEEEYLGRVSSLVKLLGQKHTWCLQETIRRPVSLGQSEQGANNRR
jgi:hypothetical protein